MKLLEQIQFLVLLSTSNLIFGQFGRAVLAEQPRYESYDIYTPHDNFLPVESPYSYRTDPVTLKFEKDGLTIKNTHADGLTGHSIIMHLSHELEITEVKYNEWTDNIDGSSTEYTVGKIILSLNKNPFNEKYIIGHYTLQIRENYHDGWLTNNGWKPNPKGNKTSYLIFHGKFKIYTAEEISREKLRLDSIEKTRGHPQPKIIINSPTIPFPNEGDEKK